MAMTHFGPISLQNAPHTVITSRHPTVYYNAYADELIFKLDDNRHQSFAMPVNDYVSLLYDDDRGETIGIQIDNFAAYAVNEHPALKVIARVVGIEPRSAEDLDLIQSDRIVRRAAEITDVDEEKFKHVMMHIIDYTGGFDEDAVIE